VFQPLMDAAPGEWAGYAALDGRTLRYDITAIEQDLVTTRLTTQQGTHFLGQPATRQDRRDWEPQLRRGAAAQGSRRTSRASVQAAGRTWNAILFEDQWSDEGVEYRRRTWVSAEAPVFGLVRMELTGDGMLEARLELTACGRAQP